MATNNEIITDILWEEMKSLAIEQQQCFYELLPDCIEYKFDEHKYLRQNIGYAIYGLPISNSNIIENSCYWKPEDSNDTSADIADTVNYDEKARSVIDIIYNKIRKCIIGNNNTQPICFGIIYNIIFRPKMNVELKKKEVKKKKTEESVREEEKESAVLPIPIFKVRRNIQKKSDSVKRSKQKENTKMEVEADYGIWYIDICGRLYKSWADYIENNNLPKCTMVVPKDGFYQANLSYPITEDYSTVWLEVIDSPACTLTTRICNGMDVISSITGFSTAGLCVASLFTPLAPAAVITGLVANGASSIWTVARSSQQLADRRSHKEPIDILNKDALPHWLGIAGTIFGLGTVGGSAALSKAAANGKMVSTFAKVAFNTVQGGNLFLNGAGIIYQGYNMIDKYMTDKTIDKTDALYLAVYIMFFTGAVIKIQFANDIIESTQGKIINDYKDGLRKKNLRKKFNRIARRAAENNACKISENAEVIKYIKHHEQILSVKLSVNQPVTHDQILGKTPHNIVWSFEQGKLKFIGFTLIDPIEYVVRLMKSDILNENYKNNPSGSKNYVDDSTTDQLRKVFCDLLNKFYLSDACPKSMNLPLIPDFEPLLEDMSHMKINEECLKKLFKIVEKLMKRSENKEDFLLMAFAFVWQYSKANLKQWKMDLRERMQSNSDSNILHKIIIAVSEAIDMILNNLCNAFGEYVKVNIASFDELLEVLVLK
ncbi:uncharacterized protein [Polyergus mexicanus]|uniref:uncharacterized protein n=1 Tax=Polyergus mexicanus TaxID=615972 RepID=UPI0038B65999